MDVLQAVAAVISIILLGVAAAFLTWFVIEVLWAEYEAWRERRRARIEAELDATSERLRRTILSLAEDLASDRDEASKALTRAMFLTTGQRDEPRS
jgi:F0F1-type ATP synthase membrane subunit b/b'